MMLKKLWNIFVGAVAAGLMIGIGGTVFLAAPDKVIGAFLFAVGLFIICTYGLRLYTGAIGYLITVPDAPGWQRTATAAMVWLGNLVGTWIFGGLLGLCRPELREKAMALSAGKLAMPLSTAFFLAVACGLLMYLAVDVYRTRQGVYQLVGIFLAVPVFILAGFEHSIADLFYLAAAFGTPVPTAGALAFVLVVTAGNSAGAAVLPLAVKLSAQNTPKD